MPAERKLVFRVHAIRRMFERRISPGEVREILALGEVIEEYPDDVPYPSRLVLGYIRGRPIHVVTADNVKDETTIVITAYKPDLARWDREFKRRKP